MLAFLDCCQISFLYLIKQFNSQGNMLLEMGKPTCDMHLLFTLKVPVQFHAMP